ncbi:CvfB family protein [Cellvibrio japonicus]|uniref:Nucleic acid binding protein n=1 Tax=Cellvibrio japonicus (strain Ueda107) TaxID=498211 RepID=B3PBI4_CELJU|nr:S1-like domain-containing RNA-binding protein [Cellvibrio japonicus]ACE82776.1 nucleic acid binding protein [Cellvibrio japonicus Ueda107]QEI13098.1 GntR family transcriptional regulator [Cellvibrio japonicus]QEI16672.1 GntR family transcriptional regulator [Cellvibrio japonicus]QEI20250.1 GntR family transcriptional regulator [Cellvibrio japonicus]
MLRIGQQNRLTIIKKTDFGIFLDGGKFGNILLPKRYVTETMLIGDSLDVFLYYDSDDCLIATTLTPKVMVGECALLDVKEVNSIGAFLDWGLPKDLLVPYGEQHKPMEAGHRYVVYVYLDAHTGRITASSKLSRHLEERASGFKPGQAVNLLICGRSDMGYKAVVNHTHLGLVFRDEALRTLTYGEQLTGYIKSIRADRKIDLSLQARGKDAKDSLAEKILADLQRRGGTSYLTDKSEPDDIYKAFQVSKGNYKNALSLLYKQRKILIEKDKITLV